MGLTFADIQAISREQSVLYPPLESLPTLTEYSEEEKHICGLQRRFSARLRRSPYFVTQVTKSAELERYADKYRPAAATQPKLERRDLHQPFFPQEIFEAFFDPRKKRMLEKKHARRVNLDDFKDDAEEEDKSEASEAGSQAAEEDYDVEEEYDNDYADDYFDNGEGDDLDDLGGGAGAGDPSGGGALLIPMLLFTFSILLFANPISVFACEGDCIIGITQAWLGNYTSPIYTVFQHIAQQISRELLPAGHDSMQYLDPITSAYKGGSNDGMRAAIFPNYFHGKCQRNGVDPLGCPNPDCPVICGTPGSLVHFFPTLRFIAFNYTRSTLQRLCSPGSDAYERAERSVVQTAAGPRGHGGERRRVPWFEYAIARAGGELAQGRNISYVYARRREEGVKKRFEEIMKQVPSLLEQACGGHPSEDENALPKCSWENLMKQYILNFP
ncbi:DNA-directed RNA polymerase III subunit Rpc31 domain containing protein [Russula decolorans]